MQKRMRRRRGLTPPGPLSLFRMKVREPVSLTLTKAHHEKIRAIMDHLGLTRADAIGLLIERVEMKNGVPQISLTREEQIRLEKPVDVYKPLDPSDIPGATPIET